MTEQTFEQQEAARRQAERKADADAVAKATLDESANRQRQNAVNNISNLNAREFDALSRQLIKEGKPARLKLARPLPQKPRTVSVVADDRGRIARERRYYATSDDLRECAQCGRTFTRRKGYFCSHDCELKSQGEGDDTRK